MACIAPRLAAIPALAILWGVPVVDVFISYSRHDKERVAQLAHKMQAEGYDVWWDAELPPHKSYGDVITEKIGEAKAAVVVWSDTAAQSEWVRAEADVARNQKKLIQTALGDIMPPLPFNQIQFADIGDWQGEDDHRGWRKVKASLAELCGERAAAAGAAASAAPPPPPPPAEPEPEPVAEATEPSKWPLYAGIGVALAALIAVGAFVAGSMNENEAAPSAAIAEAAETDESAGQEDAADEPETPQDLSAAPRFDNLQGRRVGCYFSYSIYQYDGACDFVTRSGGDFVTTSLSGPYFEGVTQIGLDVTADNVGTLEIYYPGGGVERIAVSRSSRDRACWQGNSVIFCAR